MAKRGRKPAQKKVEKEQLIRAQAQVKKFYYGQGARGRYRKSISAQSTQFRAADRRQWSSRCLYGRKIGLKSEDRKPSAIAKVTATNLHKHFDKMNKLGREEMEQKYKGPLVPNFVATAKQKQQDYGELRDFVTTMNNITYVGKVLMNNAQIPIATPMSKTMHVEARESLRERELEKLFKTNSIQGDVYMGARIEYLGLRLRHLQRYYRSMFLSSMVLK